jgi:hypothetical protein
MSDHFRSNTNNNAPPSWDISSVMFPPETGNYSGGVNPINLTEILNNICGINEEVDRWMNTQNTQNTQNIGQ